MLRTVLQRSLIIPAVLLALPLAVLLTPIALLILIPLDLVGGYRRLPLARIWIYGVVVLCHEWWAISARIGIGVGRATRLYHRRPKVMAVWAGSLLAWAGRIFGIKMVLPDSIDLPPGRLVLLSRHSSAVDAIAPAWLVNGPMSRPVHYILKRELRWVPSINLFVPVLGNHLVQRSADTQAELSHIARLAKEAIPESVLVIFPEGTYGTPENRARIRASLERRGETEAVALSDRLHYLLPPKPDGVATLLENRPDADVIIFGHTGVEQLVGFGALRKHLPLSNPVVFDWWHVPRSAVPEDPVEQERWLQNEWERLDRWVDAVRSADQQT